MLEDVRAQHRSLNTSQLEHLHQLLLENSFKSGAEGVPFGGDDGDGRVHPGLNDLDLDANERCISYTNLLKV